MKKMDYYWMSNDKWWTIKNGVPVVREDAPDEARQSYKRYILQNSKKEE